MTLFLILVALVAAGYIATASRRLPAPRTGPEPTPESPGPPPPTDSPAWTSAELRELIRSIALEEDYRRPELVEAIARVESSFNPSAVNRADAPASIGLCQLQLQTARAYVPWIDREEQLLDAPANIRAAVRFLKDLEHKHGRNYGIAGVIQMYNLGEPRFHAGKRSPEYLRRVLAKLPAGYAAA
jgi:soluble lytic murein transglycosylase-like protein